MSRYWTCSPLGSPLLSARQHHASVWLLSTRLRRVVFQIRHLSASTQFDHRKEGSQDSKSPDAEQSNSELVPDESVSESSPLSCAQLLERSGGDMLTWEQRQRLEYLRVVQPRFLYDQQHGSKDPRGRILPFPHYLALWYLGFGGAWCWIYSYWSKCMHCEVVDIEAKTSHSEKEGHEGIEPLDNVLCTRLCGHLGPYVLPVLLKRRQMHQRALQVLASPSSDSLTAYSAMVFLDEALQRRVPANYILYGPSRQSDIAASSVSPEQEPAGPSPSSHPNSVCEAEAKVGLVRLLPLFEWFLKTAEGGSSSQVFGTTRSALLSATCYCLQKDREIPYMYLQQFLMRNKQYWSGDEELRAFMIFKLLQNRSNALKVHDEEGTFFLSESYEKEASESKHGDLSYAGLETNDLQQRHDRNAGTGKAWLMQPVFPTAEEYLEKRQAKLIAVLEAESKSCKAVQAAESNGADEVAKHERAEAIPDVECEKNGCAAPERNVEDSLILEFLYEPGDLQMTDLQKLLVSTRNTCALPRPGQYRITLCGLRVR
eukprot:GHVQ01024241.1.p1 GENE.GHVQ01024241.1~~GHVQ01024241.1.p1  ORF type:complete len:542 (+),score=37.81 GHVQ01024241.1:602-2227(+)